MSWRLLLLIPVWLLLAGLAPGPRLYADLSVPKVEITYGYAGAEILVYGAVQYPGGRLPGESPKIAIVARGPEQAVTVRRKERVAGIWINASDARFLTAPAFVLVASTAPMAELVDERTAAVWELGLPYLQFSPYGGDDPAAGTEFLRGLINLRRAEGLYREAPRAVRVTDNILYRARLAIPSAAPVGDYTVTVHLIRDGDVVATVSRVLSVEKTGFEARISRFAENRALLYGLVTVALAVLTGWIGSLVTGRQ